MILQPVPIRAFSAEFDALMHRHEFRLYYELLHDQKRERVDPDARLSMMARHRGCLRAVGGLEFSAGWISYFVAPSVRNRGFATEMVLAGVSLVATLVGLEFVRASVVRENAPSRRVLEKAGFEERGTTIRRLGRRRGRTTMVLYQKRLA